MKDPELIPLHTPKVKVSVEPFIANPDITGKEVATGCVSTRTENGLDTVVPVPALSAVTEINK